MTIDYSDLNNVHEPKGDLNSAVEFHKKALMLNEGLNSKEGKETYSKRGN